MRHRSFRTLLALAAIVVFTTVAGAQRADTTARRDSAGRLVRALPPVVVTGSLTSTSTQLLGLAASLIPRTTLENEPARFAVDQLRHVTGVHIDEADGPLGPTIVRLRGGEEQFTQILVDGIQVNENGGFFDAQGITLVNVNRVEVARGPQSTVYGTSAMSGAVQIISRSGVPGSNTMEASIEGARTSPFGGSRRATVEASGGTDVLRYSAGLGKAFDRGVFALPNDLHSDDASMRLDYVPLESFQVSATARYMGVTSLLPVLDPGVDRAPLDPNQRQGRNRIIGGLEAAWRPNAHWTNRFTLDRYHLLFTYDNQKDAYDTTKYTIGFFNANYHYHDVVERTTARYVGTVTGTPSSSLALTGSFGSEWERETLDADASGDFGPSTTSLSRPSVAGFGEGQARIADRVTIDAGARAESFRGVGAAIVPRATAVVDVIPGTLSLRTALAKAYKAPNIQDQYADPGFFVGNPDLKAETSRSMEIGVDVTAGATHTSLTAFHQRYDDLIRTVPFGTDKSINENIGRTRASGFEAETGYDPKARWHVGAEASWTSTTVVDNSGLDTGLYPDGQPLPFRPAYTASGNVDFPVTSALSLSARVTAVGRQTVLANRFGGDRVSVAPYRVFEATALYPITSAFEVYARAENAFNTTYATAYDKPGAPRSVAFGLRVRN